MVLTSGKVGCAPSSPCSRRSGRCAWLRAAVLLSSPSLRATADALSGRDRKAGALAEPESWVRDAAARITVSRSGLSVTAATGVQSRVAPLQRCGLARRHVGRVRAVP